MPPYTAGEATAADVSAQERDADVVLHIRSGDLSRAFELLIQRYEGKVYRLCVAYLGGDPGGSRYLRSSGCPGATRPEPGAAAAGRGTARDDRTHTHLVLL